MKLLRRAVLVGEAQPNDRHDLEYLRGVRVDLENYKNFLKSKIGGLWRDEEIYILFRRTRDEILSLLSSIDADYTFILFAGHGGYIEKNDSKVNLLLWENGISEDELQTKSRRQLLILDCCRKTQKDFIGPVKPNVAKAPIDADYRRIFDYNVKRCSEGIVKIYSCGKNEAAAENFIKGSAFSFNLLQNSRFWSAKQPEVGKVLDIHEAFNLAKDTTTREIFWQHPEFNGGRRLDFFPFAISAS